MNAPHVIIGSGLAGWTTARELRKLDAHTPIELFTANSGDFYAKPSLSNAFTVGRDPASLVTTPGARMAETLNVTLHAHTPVEHIDTAQRRIHTAQGTHTYGQLVLSTGAQPIAIPLQGTAAHEVLSVNSLEDFAVLHARLGSAKRQVVIMGAGLIGCEFANDLAAAGHHVRVVDPSPRALASLLPEPVSQQLQSALQDLGVQWHLGTHVVSVDPAQVTLANGQTLAADAVLSAVGLRPDTRLAQAAGLVCERGVVVDTHLQTSAPGVYSLGDGTAYASAQGLVLPYVMPIMAAARSLAGVLTGGTQPLVFGLMPVSVKTPALPLVVAPPAPGAAGRWQETEPGLWQFVNGTAQHGFVLVGAQTKRRAEQSQLTQT